MVATAGSPTTLFIARHGQSEWNHQSRVTGQTDIDLSPLGLQQGEALAQCMDGVALAAIYTSTLRRTVATARPTATRLALPPTPLAELDELNMGVLQGRYRDERDVEAQAIWALWQADPWGRPVPGGERFDEFTERVERALQGILQRHAGRSVLIVGHRATNRVLLGNLLAWPRQRWAEIRLRNKHCYRVVLGDTTAIDTYTLSGSKTGSCQPGFVM